MTAWKMPARKPVTAADIDRAIAIDAAEAQSELRACKVTYDARQDILVFFIDDATAIGVRRDSIEDLDGIRPAELKALRLWPDGVLLELPGRDVHIHVPRLLERTIRHIAPPALLRSMFASLGGRATSERKRRAAAANGRKGGRPKKAVGLDDPAVP